jgi:gliding motility-associated-like protein
MKKVLYIILVLCCCRSSGQTITPQVFNSAGSERDLGNTGFTLLDNIGEPFIQTIGNDTIVVTQGFIQPDAVSKNEFTASVVVNDISCNGKDDGLISTAINTKAFGYEVKYYWKPAAICPGDDCSSIENLKVGNYSLTIVCSFTTLGGKAKSDTVYIAPADSTVGNIKRPVLRIQDLNGPCQVQVFTGITINGDGKNEHLYIENIEQYPNNTVSVFNRWGTQLYRDTGYDNVNKFWPRVEEADKLVAGTYFYVLEIGDGSKTRKGWIEIIKNQ